MRSLFELYREHQGKVSDKWSIYLAEYDRLFSSYRARPVRMLEIGIQNGGSLEIWSKYFPGALALVGCDINPDCAKLTYEDSRINVVVGDANTDATEAEILTRSPTFDLIIDDGSHTSGDIVKSFARYFRHLSLGGIFVAEDLHCSYWSDFEGGLYYPYSSISFFKRLADVVNHEHWGIEKERKQLLQGFANQFATDFEESDLAEIHLIEFFNSVCVVHKRNPRFNVLGQRFIAGENEFVVSGHLSLSGSSSPSQSQTDNSWSELVVAPEEDWERLTKLIAEREGQIAGLNQAVAEREGQIAGLNQAVAEREGQIAGLNQAVAERDGQIRNILNDLSAIKASTSWRITAPIRSSKKFLVKYVFIINQALKIGSVDGFLISLKKIVKAYRAEGMAGLKIRMRAKIIHQPVSDSKNNFHKGVSDSVLERYLPAKNLYDLILPEIVVDIIIPVYRGLEFTRNCIESTLSATCFVRHRVIVIDDCSPEPAVSSYLNSLKESKNLIVLRNQTNLGFVGTVNRGMQLSKNDVVLLNSDAEVSDGWLDRICHHVYKKSNHNIGTVTPFSNNATICSYPTIYGTRSLPKGESLKSINIAFYEANRGRSVDIPTAVGFCMYIRRACLDEVGFFDEEAFGKGYGEENDFCQRATAAGWNHLLAADTYVFHAGEVSFQGNSTPGKLRAMEILRSRYPSYEKSIIAHVTRAEANPFRVAATASRFRHSAKPVILMIGHALGGGTEKHWLQLIERFSDCGHFLVLKPILNCEGFVNLSAAGSDDFIDITVELATRMEFLIEFLKSCNVTRVHIHHLMGLQDLIGDLVRRLGVPFDFTVHDYFTICPRVNLAIDGRYCGEPDIGSCNRCIKSDYIHGSHDIVFWRQKFSWIFQDASRLICPSQDVASRILRYHPASKPTVWSHEVIQAGRPTFPPLVDEECMRVAIIGWLAPHKGLGLVSEFVKYAIEVNFPVSIRLIGSSGSRLTFSSVYTETGEYKDIDLPKLIEEFDPHLIWFTSTWPETYSYTLSASIFAGRPVLVPNLGAFPERIKLNPMAWTFPWNTGVTDLASVFSEIRQSFNSMAEINSKNLNIPNQIDFYLSEYLKFEGKPSKELSDLRGEGWISAVVIVETYSTVPGPCAYIRILLPLMESSGGIPVVLRVVTANEASAFIADMFVTHRVAVDERDVDSIVEHCRKLNIPLIYDLDDDLIGIAASDHPESKYYSSFVPTVKKLLGSATNVRVSTRELAAKVSAYSNSVSVAPNALSLDVWGIKHAEHNINNLSNESVSILYMGTQTHHADFEIVIPALRSIKLKFGNKVNIFIIGITVSREFGDFCEFLDVPSSASSSYPAFVAWLQTGQKFDIGIAPLVNNEFNSSKSGIKFLDYTALGLTAVCSDVPAYRELVSDGVNGVLVADSDWEPALTELIHDSTLRMRLSKAAFQLLVNRFSIGAAASLNENYFWGLCKKLSIGNLHAAQVEEIASLS